jgi:transcriptional regulator with XRE-family HTH domain
MADFKTATTVGARIAALRKARGFSSAKALADAIPGDSITESILQNIEAGRKNDLAVAQLLNIAWALRVSPLFILAPLGTPHEHLDLPNILDEVRNLEVGEFDAWVSGIGGIYRPVTADEMSERTQLEALRELLRARREAHRLSTLIQLDQEMIGEGNIATPGPDWADPQQRLDDTDRQIAQLEAYLGSGGWNIAHHGSDRQSETNLDDEGHGAAPPRRQTGRP